MFDRVALSFFAEFLGTFLLVLAVIMTTNPLAIGGALAFIVFFGGSLSGAHVNPAISLAKYLGGKLNSKQLAGYVASQLAGAVSALYIIKFFA